MTKIMILTTGGTIEKSYSETEGDLTNRESLLKQKLLAKLRLPNAEVQLKEVMAKDSLQMTTEDRQLIFDAVVNSFSLVDAVLVLHGTDTLVETMKHCETQIQNPRKPVVFTGAMKPAGFDDTDALQNFTEAMFCTHNVDPGYYLVFHGQLFKGTNVRKNRDKRTFEYES